MDAKEVRKTVENYEKQVLRLEKMMKRLISMSGRDLEQENAILQRIEELERGIAMVDSALDMKELTSKEQCAVMWRLEGKTYAEVGAVFEMSRERGRQLLESAYEKMAVVSQTMHRRRR